MHKALRRFARLCIGNFPLKKDAASRPRPPCISESINCAIRLLRRVSRA